VKIGALFLGISVLIHLGRRLIYNLQTTFVSKDQEKTGVLHLLTDTSEDHHVGPMAVFAPFVPGRLAFPLHDKLASPGTGLLL
jgi:hypothetical protein